MKTKTCISTILLAVGLTSSHAQDTWTPKANFGGKARYGAVGFSIGSKGYIGTGATNVGYVNDFWAYDPVINAWTQKADFGGVGREFAVAFSTDNKGYIGTGDGGLGDLRKDFWEYDPDANSWTQKADFAGTARWLATGFSTASKGYIGTGAASYDLSLLLDDFWEYDPATDVWTQKADFGGIARKHAVGFSIGSKGYIGTGSITADDADGTNDFWEYNPATNSWTRKANFAGTARGSAVGLSIDSNGYIGTGIDNTGNLKSDFWEYDPPANTWTQKANFGGVTRQVAAGLSIGGKGYVGTGLSSIGNQKDFWEYTPDGGSSSGCLPPPAGLVSWWAGDKTAQDVQGANNGTLLNGASFRPGEVGPGFLLDGIDDWIRVPNSPSLSQTRITLDAWVYPTGGQGSDRHIISKDNEVAREYILALNADDKFAAFVGLPSGGKLAGGTTIAQLNTWYHVAMTQDGLKLRLYVNGVIEGILDAVGDVVPTHNPVGIGANVLGHFFPGIIDEAQIFSRALTDAEILAIYEAGATGQCKPEIFVSSITPSYEVVGHRFLISTSVVIQDENGIGIEDASVVVKAILPNGSVLAFPVTTDSTGEAIISFAAGYTGLYRFTVRKVSHRIREYDRSLNIETSDTLVIP